MNNNWGLLKVLVTARHMWLAEFNPTSGGQVTGLNTEYLGQTCVCHFWPLQPGQLSYLFMENFTSM